MSRSDVVAEGRAGRRGAGLVRLGGLIVLSLALGIGAAASEELFNLGLVSSNSPKLMTVTRHPGQPFVLQIVQRAPSRRYRVSVESPAGPVETFELPRPPETFLNIAATTEPCQKLRNLILEVLRATDEKQADYAAREMLASGERKSCSGLESSVKVAEGFTKFKLQRTSVLAATEKLKLTVSRLAQEGEAVEKTWSWQLEAPGLPADAQWTYHSEEEWLVAEISRDVAEMVIFGATRALPVDQALAFNVEATSPPAGGEMAYQVKVRAGSARAPMSHALVRDAHVWNPAAYATWAGALIERLGVKSTHSDHRAPSSLSSLLDPRAKVLERENERVSRWLDKAGLDARAHEQAAMILGTLALREAAGDFYDIRRILCRMSAHLAVARALRGSAAPSLDGEYAGILLSTLVGRQREALDGLDAMGKKKGMDPAERSWRNALTLRNTGDWRILEVPEKASLLERVEYFRALGRTQGGLRALDFLTRGAAEPIPDWGRVALEGRLRNDGIRVFAVEEGNMFASGSLSLELREMTEVLPLTSGQDAPSEATRLLGASPGRCIVRREGGKVGHRVIDHGGWAAFFQRHLCHAMQSTARHLHLVLGQHDDAEAFRTKMKGEFGGLGLFPVLDRSWSNWAPSRPGPIPAPTAPWKCEPAYDLLRKSPETVTAAIWRSLETTCQEARIEKKIIDPFLWFSPALAAGTNYDAQTRIPYLLRLDPTVLEAAVRRAPYDGVLIGLLVMEKYGAAMSGRQLTQEQFDATWGPLVGYSQAAVAAKARLAPAEGPQTDLAAMKLCEADADRCLDLGVSLFRRGMEDEGARALERGFRQARDRVGMSNRMDFLVDYYFDRGQPERAMEVASAAADVYSGTGLLTKARLLYRMGRYEEAEAWYRKLAERYPDEKWNLWNFYVRYEHRQADGRFRTQAAEALKQLFPDGLQRVAVGDLHEEPFPGPAGIRGVTHAGLAALGLRNLDVIVAVDGYRTPSLPQWHCVSGFTDDPEIAIIVFRNGKYLELKGRFRRYYFGPPHPPRTTGPPRAP